MDESTKRHLIQTVDKTVTAAAKRMNHLEKILEDESLPVSVRRNLQSIHSVMVLQNQTILAFEEHYAKTAVQKKPE